MPNIDITNSFFSYYASAATDKVATYQGMHQYIDENVTFSDMAYDNIKGKRVFAMWHWLCTKKPEPVKVTFDRSETIEKDGIVIPVYQAKYDFKRGWTMLFKNLSLVFRASTSNLYFMSHKILPICICFALAFLLFGCASIQEIPNQSSQIDKTKPKSIFVFMDGTSNNPSVPTNIYRLFKEIEKKNDNQTVADYIEGVGNAKSPLTGTAIGFGMEERILLGYKFITQHYQPKSSTYPGDRIYIFGFSRGAHTARSLAGLISYAGVPKLSDAKLDNILWNNIFTSEFNIGNKILELTKDQLDVNYAKVWEKWQRDGKPPLTNLIRDNVDLEVQPAEVEFLGVWDTVPGSIFKKYLACELDVGDSNKERYKVGSYPPIHNIVHAVSNDEKRSMFKPLLLCPAINPDLTKVNEVVFPGAHADVGGGYDDKNNQLPDISLNWMVDLLDKHYPSPPKSHQFINASNADPKGLAHLSISDPQGSTHSHCSDRKLDFIARHQSIMVRKNAGGSALGGFWKAIKQS
jgi:uncharacterized protein (DUF2235 family)